MSANKLTYILNIVTKVNMKLFKINEDASPYCANVLTLKNYYRQESFAVYFFPIKARDKVKNPI